MWRHTGTYEPPLQSSPHRHAVRAAERRISWLERLGRGADSPRDRRARAVRSRAARAQPRGLAAVRTLARGRTPLRRVALAAAPRKPAPRKPANGRLPAA